MKKGYVWQTSKQHKHTHKHTFPAPTGPTTANSDAFWESEQNTSNHQADYIYCTTQHCNLDMQTSQITIIERHSAMAIDVLN